MPLRRYPRGLHPHTKELRSDPPHVGGGWGFAAGSAAYLPLGGEVAPKARVGALEYSGQHDGEVTFEIALESAGALAFGAA